jgi:hypothetical protein
LQEPLEPLLHQKLYYVLFSFSQTHFKIILEVASSTHRFSASILLQYLEVPGYIFDWF